MYRTQLLWIMRTDCIYTAFIPLNSKIKSHFKIPHIWKWKYNKEVSKLSLRKMIANCKSLHRWVQCWMLWSDKCTPFFLSHCVNMHLVQVTECTKVNLSFCTCLLHLNSVVYVSNYYNSLNTSQDSKSCVSSMLVLKKFRTWHPRIRHFGILITLSWRHWRNRKMQEGFSVPPHFHHKHRS